MKSPQKYERGQYYIKPKWSKDSSMAYYQGFEMKIVWPAIKYVILIVIWLLLHILANMAHHECLLSIILITLFYQEVIALVMGLSVVPTLDAACFLSSSKSHVNFVSVSTYDSVVDRGIISSNIQRLMSTMPKFTQCIESCFGDYYYKTLHSDHQQAKKIALERALIENRDPKTMLQTWDDVDKWVQDNINIKMCNDGPMFQLYFQKFGKGTLMIWKSHHSFCDGVSIMSMSLAMTAHYGREYFIGGKDASLLQRVMTRCSVPFVLPGVLWANLLSRFDDNIITRDRENKISGVMNCVGTGQLDFKEIKNLSKKLGVTINDLVACSISSAMGTVFKERGDDSKEIQMVIPSNVRFQFYPTWQQVKLENKFAGLLVNLPLADSMQTAYDKVSPAMKVIKNNFLSVYCSYIIPRITIPFLPKSLPRRFIDNMSQKATLGFSNVPGPIKQFYYEGNNGKKIMTISQQTYIVISGYIGLAICCMSFVDSFKVTVTCDDGIMPRQFCERLCQLIEENIRSEMKRMEHVAVPEAKKKKD